MEEIFIALLQSSIWGGVTIAFILVMRLLLKNTPRRLICLLWLLAAIRLLIPVHIYSNLSIQPQLAFSSVGNSAIRQNIIPEENVSVVVPENPPVPDAGTAPLTDVWQLLSVVWISVSVVFLLYTAISYLFLKLKLRNAAPCGHGVYEAKEIRSAFLFGYFCPKIYLPTGLSSEDRLLIIAHEKAHLARLDNWWKLLGFLCICIHWYNPFVWFGYIILCRDIEGACDERVISNMDAEKRKAYSKALLNCGKRISALAACPVAFGEVNLKQRIKNILSYRKPGLWFSVASILLAVLIAVCFLTTPEIPKEDNTDPILQTQPVETAPSTETVPAQTVPTETVPITEPATEPTVPPATKPKPSNPSTTPSQPPSSNNGLNVSGYLPEKIIGADTSPAVNTADHTHSYSATTVVPYCTSAGYTEYICGCGHTYYDNFVNASGHNWVFEIERKATATTDGGKRYKCSICDESKIENRVPAAYTTWDLEKVDSVATKRAANYGFQTMDTYTNTNVMRFQIQKYAEDIDRDGGEKYLLSEAKNLVDCAYDHCLASNCSVSSAVVWVDVREIAYSNIVSVTITVYCAT